MRDSFFANTELIGLIGHPIKHSYSPFIQNYALELINLDYIYLPFDVPAENLKSAVNGVLALGLKGLNVTLPHKEKIINKGNSANLGALSRDLEERDQRDAAREVAPLNPAADAVSVDSSELTIGEVVDRVLKQYQERTSGNV